MASPALASRRSRFRLFARVSTPSAKAAAATKKALNAENVASEDITEGGVCASLCVLLPRLPRLYPRQRLTIVASTKWAHRDTSVFTTVTLCGILVFLSASDGSSSSLTPDFLPGLNRRGPDGVGAWHRRVGVGSDDAFFKDATHSGEGDTNGRDLHILGSLLQLRGSDPGVTPVVDRAGNVLAFSGEVFGGVPGLRVCESDTHVLAGTFGAILSDAKHGTTKFVEFASKIQGPWALVFWHEAIETLWFGRDVFGRRSLLIHEPDERDDRFILSSSASFLPARHGDENENEHSKPFWREIEPGLYSVTLRTQEIKIQKHDWRDATAEALRLYDRDKALVKPSVERNGLARSSSSQKVNTGYNTKHDAAIDGFIAALACAVEKRVALSINTTGCEDTNGDGTEPETAFLGVLFSGGVDSALLAALAHRYVPPDAVIDLCTVCFSGGKSPDRESALDSLCELRENFPTRKWRLIAIDQSIADVDEVRNRLLKTLEPSNTVMDVNIGAALWFAARGEGWIDTLDGSTKQRQLYKSKAKVLLLGQGADEQCAGYRRHRGVFFKAVEADVAAGANSLRDDTTTDTTNTATGNWPALSEVLREDMCRLWKRNLGRDDRLIADHGREARFPFLDEGVVARVLTTNLSDVADLDEGNRAHGIPGDKMLIRAAAHRLGLVRCAQRAKRAIQFGSRISKQYDLREGRKTKDAGAVARTQKT